jgi:hypothetical protein
VKQEDREVVGLMFEKGTEELAQPLQMMIVMIELTSQGPKS